MRRSLTIGIILVAMASAQKKPKQPDENRSPRLVKLNVTVVDASGGRPGDLTADEFQVSDNGKPQKIVAFQKNDGKAKPIKPLGPHEFSNRSGAAVPNATVILFDLLNDRMGAKGYAWTEITHTLEQLEASEYLYLYLLGSEGAFYPVHALPDGENLKAAAEGNWARDVRPLLDAAIGKATRLRPIEMTDTNLRVIRTYESIAAISQRLAAIPGRKNLVWITRGVPISLGPMRTATGETIDYSVPLQALTAALERSGIAVYPVDITPPGMDERMDATSGAASSSSPGGGMAPIPPAGTGLGSAETLQQFADLTGGQAFLNNNVKGAILQAIGDARMSYEMAYYTNNQAYDGKLHKIKLTCSRRGVKVHTRAGYYAYNEPLITRNQQEAALDAAISSQFDASQIGINAVLSPSKKFYNSVHLDISIDLGAAADPEGGQLLITLADLHSNGKNGVSATELLDYKAGVGAIPFPRERTVDGTVEKIRIIVMDGKSNALGSLTVPIQPSDLSPAK